MLLWRQFLPTGVLTILTRTCPHNRESCVRDSFLKTKSCITFRTRILQIWFYQDFLWGRKLLFRGSEVLPWWDTSVGQRPSKNRDSGLSDCPTKLYQRRHCCITRLPLLFGLLYLDDCCSSYMQWFLEAFDGKITPRSSIDDDSYSTSKSKIIWQLCT